TNVRRHAREVTVVDATVDLAGDAPATSVVVRVHDDGLGSAAPLHDTYGLVGMRERAEALDGSLYDGPAPSGGWLVHAAFPVDTVPVDTVPVDTVPVDTVPVDTVPLDAPGGTR